MSNIKEVEQFLLNSAENADYCVECGEELKSGEEVFYFPGWEEENYCCSCYKKLKEEK